MIRLLCALVSILAALSGPVDAGAWPRPKGEGFVAVSYGTTGSQVFAEVGLGRDWTMGVDVSRDLAGRLDGLVFLHHSLPGAPLGGVWSVGGAVGQRAGDTVVRTGLFFGRGFSAPIEGWVAVEAQSELSWLTGTAYKLDATLGVKPGGRMMYMIQGQAALWPGADPSLRIEPAAAVTLGPAQIVLAPSMSVTGARDPRLKLSLWWSF